MSEIRVDTISEKTSANGVAIDSVTLKDGGATLADNITFSASGKGVHLGVTSATASNLLDDYEEGTFDGAYSGSSGSPSGVSYTHRENHYTKIGDTVYFSGYLQSGSWSSGPSGHLLFSGLPFTASSASNYFGMFNVHYSGNFNSTNLSIVSFNINSSILHCKSYHVLYPICGKYPRPLFNAFIWGCSF